MNFKGMRTLLFGAGVAVLPAALDYLGGVPWQSFGISPGVAAAIGFAIMGLRAITTGPVKSFPFRP